MSVQALAPRPAVFFWVGLGLVLTLLVGCGRRETAVESGNRTQTLHLGNLSEPNDLDPQLTESSQTFNIILALMEGLAQYDPRTCEPTPAVAERWETSSDRLTWTFHLRKDARWSNGDPVTASDFVWAYQRMLTASLGAEYASMLFALKNGQAYYENKVTDFAQVGARASDPHTLVLNLEYPVPYLDKIVCHSAWYPLHRPTLEKFGRVYERGSQWTRPGNYVGNGCFVLSEWKPNQLIRVTKSPTYWDRDAVKLAAVVFYPIENTASEESMFRAGQLHATSTLPIGKISVYQDDPKSQPLLMRGTLLATYFYRLNVTHPPFNDVRVRQALALTINRQQLVDRVTKGGELPAGHLTPPQTGGFTATSRLAYDPVRARQLLTDAGFPGGKGFPAVDLLFNTHEGHRQIAEAIQQMWRAELGIQVNLYNQEAKVYVETMRAGNYQMARFAWVGDYLDPSTFLEMMTSQNGNNQTGWSNADYDRLIAAAKIAPTQQARFEAFQECERILAEEMPVIPIYFYVHNALQRPEVKGRYSNLLDVHPLKGVSL